MDDEIQLTELTELEVVRQDAVKRPASGFPVLVMKAKAAVVDADDDENPGCGCCAACTATVAKAVNAVGGVDEKPEIAGAQRVLTELARLIQGEAAEMAAGCYSEVWDIQQLLEAACIMRCFLDAEQYGDQDDGEFMKSADGLVFKASRKFSSDERKQLASEGKALPDGSYPIPDADALHRAAILARSGHGDVAAARKLIARRAKELGVPNPLNDNDVKKDAAPAAGNGDGFTRETVTKMIEDATAEVRKSAEQRIEALAGELAVLKATPIPGQVSLTAPAAVQTERARGDLVQKAAYYRSQAERTENDRETHAYYVGKLREAENALAQL